MKKQATSAWLITALLLQSACANNKKNLLQVDQKTSKNEPTVDLGNFQPGMWRIDSVAENQTIINRLAETDIQVFNFQKDGTFSTMKVTPQSTMDRVLGDWRVSKDSIFIEKGGNVMMRYGFENNGSVLSLHGNFEIGPGNKSKPSFHLSRYVESK